MQQHPLEEERHSGARQDNDQPKRRWKQHDLVRMQVGAWSRIESARANIGDRRQRCVSEERWLDLLNDEGQSRQSDTGNQR